MNWKKLGQVFQVTAKSPLALTHAANPLPLHLDGDIYRVYYSARDEDNKSSVAYVDLNIETLESIGETEKVVFAYGPEDSFYSHGVSIGNIYEDRGHKYILFMGWQIRGENHWRGDVGQLEIINPDSIQLAQELPFMESDEEDPISLSYPFVMHENGLFKMWYGSTLNWTSPNGEMIHVIKYATSIDGKNWIKHGTAIPYEIGVAQAFSRPTLIKNATGYHMWYSFRSGDGTPYRIGYSHSEDGINWNRKHDETGIDVSETGWDDHMICYPFVFEHKENTYMLYNGNSYGKSGFGLAILEK
jgi:hypothetical protein